MKKFLLTILTGLCLMSISAQSSHNMNLIYHWTDTTLIPVPFLDNQRFNEVWGYAHNGREYAIIASTMGMHFFDITDTANVNYVDFVPGKAQGSGIIHRDMKNHNNYLYAVCDEGNSSLQIMDMQYLPDSVHLVYDNDSMIIRAHNLFIDAATEKLYIFGPTTDMFSPGVPVGYPAMIFSIVTPDDPEFLATFTHGIINYIHDGYIHNDTAILNGGNHGLYYGYFGTTTSPVEISSLPFYQDQGYNHSGWLTPDGSHYIMSDETHGMRMKMLDMTPGVNLLSTCTLVGSEINAFSIPHNQLIRGNYLYVSYYYDGVRVYDISDPCNMHEVAWYDTFVGDAVDEGYAGCWGVYPLLPSGKILASDMQTGLYVLRPQEAYFSVEENLSFEFDMYPNPASDFIQFNEAFSTVRIFDVNGKVLCSVQNEPTISVQGLSAGVYMVGVEKEGKWGYKKVMVQ